MPHSTLVPAVWHSNDGTPLSHTHTLLTVEITSRGVRGNDTCHMQLLVCVYNISCCPFPFHRVHTQHTRTNIPSPSESTLRLLTPPPLPLRRTKRYRQQTDHSGSSLSSSGVCLLGEGCCCCCRLQVVLAIKEARRAAATRGGGGQAKLPFVGAGGGWCTYGRRRERRSVVE